jgi:peptidoglycan/xylan/chitin deacetylase (PgdA/CDA1 family)
MGFDDNRYADGVEWVVNTLFKNRLNNAGKGNKSTFDGTPMKASFYVISNTEQKAAWRAAYDAGFEVGNHTMSHEHNCSDLSYEQNFQEIGLCSKYLVNEVGMPQSHIYGFRTPYLAFHPSNHSLKATRDLGMLYDCTLDEGTQGSPLQWAAGGLSSGSSLTPSKSGSSVSAAAGTINATGKLTAERLADMVITPNRSVTGADGFKISYSSNVPLHVELTQSDLESKKASHFIGMPASATSKTVTLPLNDYTFRKPYYVDAATDAAPFDLSKVGKIMISPMALDVSKNFSFEISDITFYGIGAVDNNITANKRIRQTGFVSYHNNSFYFIVEKSGTYTIMVYDLSRQSRKQFYER